MKNFEDGFTLIELMVAMVMAGLITAVIYAAYNIQTKIYTEQGKAAEVQQSIRAGIAYLQREARMAGYNSQATTHLSCGASAKPGIHTATATTFGFSMDFNGNGNCNDSGENVTYSLYTEDGIQKLWRAAPAGNYPVAERIVNIDFLYLLMDPATGTKTQSRAPAAALDRIVAVQVSLLAEASGQDRKAARAISFTVPVPAWGAPATIVPPWSYTDSVSRRLLTTTINCRNMGLL